MGKLMINIVTNIIMFLSVNIENLNTKIFDPLENHYIKVYSF